MGNDIAEKYYFDQYGVRAPVVVEKAEKKNIIFIGR